MAHFIIICGPPATGKTKYIEHLSEDLQVYLPIFSKDVIKEILFETTGVHGHEFSAKQSLAAWDILMMSVQELAAGEGMFVVEGNFGQRHRDVFKDLEANYGATFDQILFTASVDTIVDRFKARVKDGTRHIGHGGTEKGNRAEIEMAVEDQAVFANVVGRRVEIDTTVLDDLDFLAADEFFRTRLEQ